MSEELTTAKSSEIREGKFRDINTIKTEIRTLYNTAIRSELSYAIQLGHKLTEAKELVEHGEWGNWVKENLPFSQDKATMMMKIYENYGANQESLFGDLNSDTYRNLGVWQAFVLLSVPEEEREDFVKENNVEDMSVRELKQAIAERDAAQKKSAALEEDNKMLRQANIDLNMKAQNVGNLQKKAEEALARAKRAEAAKDDTVKELQAARAELAEAKAKPAIPADMIEKMQTEAREAAEKETAGNSNLQGILHHVPGGFQQAAGLPPEDRQHRQRNSGKAEKSTDHRGGQLPGETEWKRINAKPAK